MNSGWRRKLWRAMGAFLAFALGAAAAWGQAAPQEKPPMADEVFKNIQVLRGLTVDQFMGTMGVIASALSMNCSECHDLVGNADFASDAIPRKLMARRMILMVDMFNKTNFGGKREVTCFSCHRGAARPRTVVSLAEQYSAPPEDDPNEVEPAATPIPGAPSVDQILNRYIQVLGGAQKLAGLTSFVAQGSYAGFDTAGAKGPVDIYAKAPNQRTTVVHLPMAGAGDNVRAFDGQNAWNTSEGTFMPIPVVTLSGGDLLGAKLDAALSFPGQIKQLLSNWTANFSPTSLDDDTVVNVVQGMQPDNTPVKLFFDQKTGLLRRQVRYSDTPIGLNPAQIDYEDYRDVAGVKMPFKITVTWTDGRSEIELTRVQPNVAVEASRFAKPQAAHR